MISGLSRSSGIILISFLLSGCLMEPVKSLNPFYTKEILTQFTKLEGNWKPVDPKSEIEIFSFEGEALVIKTKDGDRSSLSVKYFTIKDSVYLDVTASKNMKDEFTTHTVPFHSLFKIKRNNNQLSLFPLYEDEFNEKITKEGISFLSVLVDDSLKEYYISPSSDWINFLTKFGEDKELFKEEFSVLLEKIEY